MKLTPGTERFVLHWGEMGSRWGFNRSIAQVHALLYLSADPIPAESISETLGIARSNVSTALKELQSWGLIHRAHVLGDRRDHFTAITDLWEILEKVVEGRKRREIDPTLEHLRDCVAESETDQTTDPVAAERIRAMLTFVDSLNGWYGQMHRLPRRSIVALIKLGARIERFLGG
jgi:DNA-binding transcriptional regulator GbsR (MarR family)